MKLFRKLTTLLCALAMVLSLVPCAFAEAPVDSSEWIITGTEPNDGTAFWYDGDVTVTKEGAIEVAPMPDVDSGYAFVGGTLTNEGTVSAGDGSGSATVNIGQGLENSGTLTVAGSDQANLIVGDIFSEEKDDVIANLENSGKITVTSTGEYGSYIGVEGNLTNNNSLDMDGIAANIEVGGNLTNAEGSIVNIAGSEYTNVYVNNGDFKNDGTFNLTNPNGSSGSNAGLYVTGNAENNNALTIESNGLAEFWLTNDNGSEGKLENNGTITVKTTGGPDDDFYQAWVVAEGGLTNNGTITVESPGEAVVSSWGDLENRGEISVTGTETIYIWDDEAEEEYEVPGARVGANGKLTNYNTITIQAGDKKSVYYGVNYVDDTGYATESALSYWEDGLAGQNATVLLKNNTETRDGYTFGGWIISGMEGTFQSGQKTSIFMKGITSIKALWNAIVRQAAPTAVEAEKSGEQIVRFLDLKVLDADRREMARDIEYYRVAETSCGRLVVLFSQEQIDAMPSGANLFYIVTANGQEVEYTLYIA